jgi:cardiolipin synthase A/B
LIKYDNSSNVSLKYVLLLSLCLACGLMQLVSGCASLPNREEVLSESARGPATPQVKSSQGNLSAQKSEHILEHAAGDAEEAEQLKRLVQSEQAITGRPLIAGNRVTLLVDGPTTYKAMFDAIKKAKHHIHLETYVLTDLIIGQRFADLLLERRSAGVDVKVIYDAVGSHSSSSEYFDRLRAGGVLVHEFHPVDIRVWRLTQRDHRKLLIVDGKVTFTGGINISDVYSSSRSLSSNKLKKHDTTSNWRDTDVRIEGPAVAEFQKLFLQIWAQGEKKEEEKGNHAEQDFPPLSDVGHDLVRVIAGTPKKDEYSIYKAYLNAISLARWRVWITQAYLSPNDQFIDALKDAAQRGVDVRIILSGFTVHNYILYTSRAHYTKMLKAGVKLYELNDRMLHAKTAVIDDMWSTVGSSNLDYLSLVHDNEANAVIVGRDFGQQMEDLFQRDLSHTRSIELERWELRSPWERTKEQFFSLFKYWF